jgi:hypothetical protein
VLELVRIELGPGRTPFDEIGRQRRRERGGRRLSARCHSRARRQS